MAKLYRLFLSLFSIHSRGDAGRRDLELGNFAFSKSHVRVRSQSRKCMQSAPNHRGGGRRIGFGYGGWVGKKGVCLLRAQGLDHDEIHEDLRRKLPWAGAAKFQGHKAGSAPVPG